MLYSFEPPETQFINGLPALYLNGEQIHRERSEVLLIDDLRKYLLNRYAAEGLTASEVDSIILRLRSISGTIYEANKAVCKMVCDGFISVSYPHLWMLLLERDIKKASLRHEVGLSAGTWTNLNTGEEVSLSILLRVCDYLNCDSGDICEACLLYTSRCV